MNVLESFVSFLWMFVLKVNGKTKVWGFIFPPFNSNNKVYLSEHLLSLKNSDAEFLSESSARRVDS